MQTPVGIFCILGGGFLVLLPPEVLTPPTPAVGFGGTTDDSLLCELIYGEACPGSRRRGWWVLPAGFLRLLAACAFHFCRVLFIFCRVLLIFRRVLFIFRRVLFKFHSCAFAFSGVRPRFFSCVDFCVFFIVVGASWGLVLIKNHEISTKTNIFITK